MAVTDAVCLCDTCKDKGIIQTSSEYDCFICEQYGSNNGYKCTLCGGRGKYITHSVSRCNACGKFEDKLDILSKL